MDKPQSDESDSMYGSDQDSDEEFEDCGRDERIGCESDTDDDEWLESVVEIEKVNKEDEKLQKELVECYLRGADEDVVNDLGYSSYEESEGDVNSPGESEEDDIRGKKYKQDIPVVDEQTDWNKWIWVVGTRFPSRDAFKEAVRKYAVTNGRNLSVSVSDKNRQGRVGVKCEKGCVFKLYLSMDESKGCYRLKTANNKHTCQRNMTRNKQLTSRFIANEFLPLFKAKPHWPAKEIQEAVKEKFKVLIETWMAYKAKRCAHMKLHGSMKEHYSKIGSYLEALRYANPTSTFELVTIPPKISSDVDVFKRIFVCFDGVKKGFMAGCRKILCLDGCFLKTFLKGMLLAAVGRDGNNQMYPLAWAVVEGENKDSWAWFLMELKNCLALNDSGKGWTLISDQQKGLVNAAATVWTNAEHRNCARHIYANWHKKFKGDDLKGLFWKAVRAYCEPDYKNAIQEMRVLSPAATEAFINQNPRCFCRCFLDIETKCDVVVSNMAETFNGYIIKSRSKHILNMLEDIRVAIMTRLAKMQKAMGQKDVIVCPRIQKKLDKEKDKAYKCVVYLSSVNVFQVKDLDDVCVDLVNKTCTCRKWDLTGIPCYHACAVAGFMRKNAEEFVNDYYTKEMYMKSYAFAIPPLPSDRYWPPIDFPLDPPPIKIGPGRPKKNRKKDPHEDPKRPGKLTKHGVQMGCSNCKSKDHNIRRCPNRGQTLITPKTKRSRGRPKSGSRIEHDSNKIFILNECAGTSTRGGRGRGRGMSRRGQGDGGWNMSQSLQEAQQSTQASSSIT